MSAQQSLSFEDQNKINKFSKYLQRKNVILSEIEKLEKEISLDSTASEELEVLIEDKVDYQIGNCFLEMPTENALESVKKSKKKNQSRIKELQAEKVEYLKLMSELKQELYNKFGNQINLDE